MGAVALSPSGRFAAALLTRPDGPADREQSSPSFLCIWKSDSDGTGWAYVGHAESGPNVTMAALTWSPGDCLVTVSACPGPVPVPLSHRSLRKQPNPAMSLSVSVICMSSLQTLVRWSAPQQQGPEDHPSLVSRLLQESGAACSFSLPLASFSSQGLLSVAVLLPHTLTQVQAQAQAPEDKDM